MPMNQPIMPQQPVKYQGSYLEMLKKLLMQNPQLMQELAGPKGNIPPEANRNFIPSQSFSDPNVINGPELQNYLQMLRQRRVQI